MFGAITARLCFFWFGSNIVGLLQEEFEDTNMVSCISKKNKQHNGLEKKYKRTNNDLQNTHKTKDRVTRTPLKQLINLTRRQRMDSHNVIIFYNITVDDLCPFVDCLFFFDIQILITPLLSSNSSANAYFRNSIKYFTNLHVGQV
jgi:hypothetical protein